MFDPTAADLLATTYDALIIELRDVDDDTSWNPTGCRGWAVRDLTHHCLGDAQRALVAHVRTQGHVLRVDDLLSTLTVEATVHHLDLVTHLPEASGPTADGLREVRRVVDGLLGGPAATTWSDERYARVATGRADPTDDEAENLGSKRDRLPVFA